MKVKIFYLPLLAVGFRSDGKIKRRHARDDPIPANGASGGEMHQVSRNTGTG